MRKSWKDLDHHGKHWVIKYLFYGGMICMLVALPLITVQEKSGTPTLSILLGCVGVIACFGGFFFGLSELRCPYCGRSLMLGGRLPNSLPKFCPECGKPL